MHSSICARAQKEGSRLGKLHKARYHASPPLSLTQCASPPRDETQRPSRVSSHLVLPVCFSHPLFFSLPSLRSTTENPSAAGLATVRQMRSRRSLPRLLCVSCGSGVHFWKHLHEAGRGEYNLRGQLLDPQEAATVREPKKRFTTGSLRKELSAGEGRCSPPGADGGRREWAWRLFYFQQSGNCLAAHCPAPGAIGRYTA